MQRFLGYSSFSDEPPFDASLFVTFRKYLRLDVLNTINEKIIAIKTKLEDNKRDPKDNTDSKNDKGNFNKGTVLMDASACPQDII